MRSISTLLDGAVMVDFDDYDSVSNIPKFGVWIASGADPNEWKTPRFVEDLRTLRDGGTAHHPLDRNPIVPTRFIVADDPFGRARRVMREIIDFSVHIDTPLDVAFLRRLRRGLAEPGYSEDYESSCHYVNRELAAYLGGR